MKKFLTFFLIIASIAILALGYLGYYVLQVAVCPGTDRRHQIDTCYDAVFRRYPELQPWYDSLVSHSLLQDTLLLSHCPSHALATVDAGWRHAVVLHHDSLATGTTVVLHGYEDNVPRMLRYAYLHYEVLGRNVIVPEHFGHGGSNGNCIRFGWLDRQDVRDLWIPAAHQLWPGQDIVVHGLSMGGAITMFTAGETFADSLRLMAFIEDCGYSSTWDQLEYQLRQEFGLSAHPILDIANLWTNWLYDWDMKEADARLQLAKCQRPMLFIHGADDDYVPTSMLFENYEAKTQGYKEIWVAPGANHAESISADWDEYCQRCQEFIERCKTMNDY